MFTEKLEFVVLYRFVDIKSEVSDMTELLRKIKYLFGKLKKRSLSEVKI